MPRAFVAVSAHQDSIIRMLESQDVEAIPLTGDSVIDNIRSLETCQIVFVDASSPSWVFREIQEHHKLTVAVQTAPTEAVTAMVHTPEQLEDLIALLKPIAKPMTPVADGFIRRLATIMSMFPPSPTCRSTSQSS